MPSCIYRVLKLIHCLTAAEPMKPACSSMLCTLVHVGVSQDCSNTVHALACECWYASRSGFKHCVQRYKNNT